jgi:hypothetical protein
MQGLKKKSPQFYLLFLFILFLFMPTNGVAGGPWWDVEPEEENPSPYYDSILYSEIAPRLREIEVNSNRVKVDVIGQSAGGRNLFLVTLSDPSAMGPLGQYQAIRNTMLKDPEKALDMIDDLEGFKVPVFINGSIHGNEYTGVDAAIRLIETLAYEDSEEVKSILENVILMVNVVPNPDGRVEGTSGNSKSVDLNLDFIMQTQPETRAIVKLITEWNPLVLFDLHNKLNTGVTVSKTMLIEPSNPPHNPNYEYDLYIQWALYQAYAMEDELVANSFTAIIPFRDSSSCGDWLSIYTSRYAMYHATYGHTLETHDESEVGVDAHYHAIWGALQYVAENRYDMISDQIEIFRRGSLGLPQQLIPGDILAQTACNQITIKDFPAAYVIPAQLLDFLTFNGIQVEKANESFQLDGVTYPKGKYIVWMDQPKRGLANAFLEERLNVEIMQEKQNIKTSKVK